MKSGPWFSRDSTSQNDKVIGQASTLVMQNYLRTCRWGGGKHWIDTLHSERIWTGSLGNGLGSSIITINLPILHIFVKTFLTKHNFLFFLFILSTLLTWLLLIFDYLLSHWKELESWENIMWDSTAELYYNTKETFLKCFKQF